mgnify:CR=1 FL=1
MEPIGPLMHEHRLIERMIAVLDAEAGRLEQGGRPDLALLFQGVEFIRTYADRLHHGKEEDILFAALKDKPLSREHEDMLQELIEDHKYGRRLVGELEKQGNQLAGGGDAPKVAGALRKLTDFYPRHIEKEDKHFFHPVLEYLSKEERRDMLASYEDLERRLVDERFRDMVQGLEGRTGGG